jgi:DNA-binding NtrC family response regulator
LARILLIDDDAGFGPLLAEALEEHGHQVHWLDSAEAGLKLLGQEEPAGFEVVLLDNCMPRMHGLEFLEELRRRQVELPVLLFTGRGTAEVAIRASKLGAFRYLPKPDDLQRSLDPLLRFVGEAASLAYPRPSTEGETVDLGAGDAEALLGQSEAMHALYEQIGLAATHEEAVLITGESGTGKKCVARAIRRHGARNDRPLLRLDCRAFAEDCLEAELFGIEAGAHPGLNRPSPGLFERADGGTILLDHFHVLGLPAQARVSRLIQEGVVQRGGRGAEPRRVNVRVLACTNHEPNAALAEGRLDPELYFLLARTTVKLPPLRERGDDLFLLADHFLRQAAITLRRHTRSFHPQTYQRLRRHPWPGNVRELQGVIHQTVLACRRDEIGPDDLHLEPNAETVVPPDAEGRPLPPSRERAYQMFLWALEQNPDLVDCTDAEVFRWLRQDLRVEGEGLPASCDTFRRYLREARAYHQDRKHNSRARRSTGRSVVRLSQV